MEPEAPSRPASSTGAAGVQTLRGIACLLVVALHVVGWSPTSGMQMAEGSFYRELADLFAPIRMPLFTFLSGFVYAYYPVTASGAAQFATKKLRRLGLPLVTLTTVYYLLTFVAGDVNGKVPVAEAWKIYAYSYVHFWFLQAIILIFAATVVLELAGALATLRRFTTTLAAAALACFAFGTLSDEPLFSYKNAIYLLPFFLLGLGANRFPGVFMRPAVAWGCALIGLVAAGIHLDLVVQIGAVTPTPIALVIGFSGVLALIYFTPRWRPLERIGAYSFTIYLLHPFAVAPARKIMQALDVDLPWMLFGVGLVAGIVVPVVFDRLAGRVPMARRLLLGQSRASGGRGPVSLSASVPG